MLLGDKIQERIRTSRDEVQYGALEYSTVVHAGCRLPLQLKRVEKTLMTKEKQGYGLYIN
jgi:hypothetical protein